MIVRCTKTKFSIKDFFSKCDQIRRFLWIWSHLLEKSFTKTYWEIFHKNIIFCAVSLFLSFSLFFFALTKMIALLLEHQQKYISYHMLKYISNKALLKRNCSTGASCEFSKILNFAKYFRTIFMEVLFSG